MKAARRLIVFLMLMVTSSTSSADQREHLTRAVEITTARLEPQHQTVFSVAPLGSPLTIGMDASGWKEAELLIEARAPDTLYTILSPEGREVRSGSVEEAGWLAVSFPVDVDGLYQLVLRTKSEAGVDRDFRIRVELLPFPSSSRGRLAKAEALYSKAEILRNSLRAGDVREAIARYGQAASDWENAGDRDARVLALSGEGLAWLELSEYKRAVDTLDRALAVNAASGQFRSWLLNLKAQVFLARWDSRSASAAAAEALRLARSLKDIELESNALVDRGASEWLTHSESAAPDIDEALRLARASGSTGTVALALRYKAWIEEDQGHLTRSLLLMEQAEDEFRRAGDGRDVLQAMSNIATIEALEGDLYSSLLRHSRLASPMMESGNTANYGTVIGNIGADYAELNRDSDAILFLQKAVRAFRSIHHDSGESIYLGQLCMVELRQKQLPEALSDCQRSASIAAQMHDPKRLTISTWRLARVHRAFGQTDLAVEDYKRAANLSKKVPDPRFESQSLIDWGDAVEAQKRGEALPLFRRALSLSEQAEDSVVQLEARFRIARWYASAGEDANAIGELKTALDQIEKQRSAVHNDDLQSSYFAAVRKCHQLYVDILMREHERNRTLPSDLLALEISESARARTLLDSLKTRESIRSLNMLESTSAERIRLRIAVEQAYDQRLKLMLEGARRRELQQNSATLTQAMDSLQRMEDDDRDDAKATVPSGRPLTAQKILQASKSSPATTLLEFTLGAMQSYLWVVQDGTINSYVLKATQKQIESLVGEWRNLAATHVPRERGDAERELSRVAAKLSCILLNNYIESKNDRLAIVADGDLAMLPFASLPLNGCDAKPGPPLITAHQIVMAPSLSIFLTHPLRDPRTRFTRELAIVANPVFDPGDDRVRIKQSDMRRGPLSAAALQRIKDVPTLPRLVGTEEEALEIQQTVGPEKASVFLGFSASVETILSPDMQNYRILHLATHGIADESTPGFSGLVLSLVTPDGRPVFGYLKTHDISNLNLHPELVVLSACDSSAGSNLSGEGVTGLAYAFLNAGATQVASTLWDVDDEVTKDLMISFYKEMYSAGRDPAEALRQSQILMMRSPHRSAPYYWAGFEITSVGN